MQKCELKFGLRHGSEITRNKEPCPPDRKGSELERAEKPGVPSKNF
jgi:hypothetical protein